jgi:hypothetical protein
VRVRFDVRPGGGVGGVSGSAPCGEMESVGAEAGGGRPSVVVRMRAGDEGGPVGLGRCRGPAQRYSNILFYSNSFSAELT